VGARGHGGLRISDQRPTVTSQRLPKPAHTVFSGFTALEVQEKILTSSFLQNNNPNDQVLVEPGPYLGYE